MFLGDEYFNLIYGIDAIFSYDTALYFEVCARQFQVFIILQFAGDIMVN